tara:strand:+ start:404 stop:1030 length:627 start_codon:yes stop_codon:yes gene_type:complete
MWGDFENETLIHNHKMAKIYKKRYQRAGDFHNSLYRLFGLITVLTSTVASTISWGTSETDERNKFILSSITTVSAVAAAIQNFYKFQENSNDYFKTAKVYAKLQNKIESVGNIHPEYRTTKPTSFFKMIQDNFDQISDHRIEISNCMSKSCYNKKNDDTSYLEEKHVKYKNLTDNEKLTFAKNNEIGGPSDESDTESDMGDITGSNIS